MGDLYHGEYPADMTPEEAQREVKHTPAEQQRLNERIEAEQSRLNAALATVAAANDEGVARAIEALEGIIEHAENRIQDGKELGEWVWRIALEDTVRDARAAIRLLSQGGGKA